MSTTSATELLPRYSPDPDGDETADRFINEALRQPTTGTWAALLSERYALQTHRVLTGMREQLDSGFTHRNAQLAAARARYKLGQTTLHEHQRMLADYETWKGKAQHFRALVNRYYRQAADTANRHRGFEQANEVRAVLLTVARAIADHREHTKAKREPTVADRLLWARLDTLRMPTDERPQTLAESIQGREQR